MGFIAGFELDAFCEGAKDLAIGCVSGVFVCVCVRVEFLLKTETVLRVEFLLKTESG